MAEIIRFGVSMDRQLVELLDTLRHNEHYPNRSEAIRALVRHQLVQSGSEDPQEMVTAVVSLIFRYGTTLDRFPLEEFSSLKLFANLQMHLESDIAIKILVVTGKSHEVRTWATRVTGQKHVLGRITIAATSSIYEELRS